MGLDMKILGIDLSSRKLALFVTDAEGESLSVRSLMCSTIEAPKKMKHRPDVLKYIHDEFASDLRTRFHGEDFTVFIEHPLVGRAGAHATIVQAQVQGLVMMLSVQSGAAGVYEVNVQSWKKAVVGHGGADKDTIKSWLVDHHPLLAELAGDDQDLVDAACVALYGRDVVQRGDKLKATAVQLDPG